MSCILPRTACEADLHMDDSFNELIFTSRCGHFKRQRWGYYVTASCAPYHQRNAMRPFPLCGRKVRHPTQTILHSTTSCDRSPKHKHKTVPWLSSSRSERHGLQCRCPSTATQPTQNIRRGDPRLPTMSGRGGDWTLNTVYNECCTWKRNRLGPPSV